MKTFPPALLDEARAALYVIQDGLIRFVNQQFCDALRYKNHNGYLVVLIVLFYCDLLIILIFTCHGTLVAWYTNVP